LLAELRDSAIDGDAVGTGFAITKALEQQRLDFGRNGVLHAFGFRVGLGPGEADGLCKQHFGKLVAKHKPLGKLAPLRGQQNVATTLYGDVPIAGHALNGGSDRRGVTSSSSASRALMGTCCSSSISQIAFR